MQVKLIVNGFDFTPWLKQGGLQQTEVIRQGRSVTTLDGTLHKAEVIKRGISAQLVEVRDETWYRMKQALRIRPATVEYIDDDFGERTARFWVSDPSNTAKTVRGGITWFSGGGFTLEEQ